MGMSIAISLGIREQNALASIFMCAVAHSKPLLTRLLTDHACALRRLHWCTMSLGFLVEYISTPKAFVDETNHFYPIGPYQFEKFRNGEDNYGRTDYYRDPRALKLISQDQWSNDRPLYDINNPDQPIAKERRDFFVGAQRTLNYVRRMVPHVFGWFAMSSAWIIMIVRLRTRTCPSPPPPQPNPQRHASTARRRTSSGRSTTSRRSAIARSPSG